MKDLMKSWSQYLLTESSLSRIYQHITEHDTALLTAFRDDAYNGFKPTMESFKTKKEAVKYLRDEIKSMAFLELDNYFPHEF